MVDVLCGNRSFKFVKNPNRFEWMDSMGRGYKEFYLIYGLSLGLRSAKSFTSRKIVFFVM